MSLGPLLRFLVEPLDVRLELVAVDPPHAAATDLDRREFSIPDECVNLWDADVQKDGHVVEGQEARLSDRGGGSPFLRLGALHLGRPALACPLIGALIGWHPEPKNITEHAGLPGNAPVCLTPPGRVGGG